jgi:putative N6-adenine-specific DNA methylase
MKMTEKLSNNLSLFAVSPPGFEMITAQELEIIGIKKPVIVNGGVNFSGNLSVLYSCNLNTGTASRILMRAGKFLAPAFPQLARRTAQIPWELFLPGRYRGRSSHYKFLRNKGGRA